ncbi:MAG: VCBS repeat-containing protein [Saprospiraceae bacterium]
MSFYSEDFDENGTCDIVLSKEYKGKLVPTRGRQCSSEQMPFIADKFPSYNLFASAGVEDIFSKEKLESSLHLQVKDFESKTLLNNGNGTYTAASLPRLAQMAPINGMIPIDINGDGNMDLICAGNMYETEVETPRYDAGTGLVMLGDGKGGLTPMRPDQSGFFTPKNVKNIALLKRAKDRLIVVANNDGPLQFFAF